MRLIVALGAMALVAVAADRTLSDQRIRLAVFLILGFFAVRIVLTHLHQQREKEQG